MLIPGRPTQSWVRGPLELVPHLYHINALTLPRVPWCANHMVISTSMSVTFPHDASTRLFLYLFSPPTYLAGLHLVPAWPARWRYTTAFQPGGFLFYVGCVLTGCVRVPVRWLLQEAAASALQWVKQHLSTLSSHRMNHCRLRAGTASFGVISQHSKMFAFSEALSSGSWGDRAHGVGQHLVAVALGFWGWSSVHRVVLCGYASFPVGSLSTSKSIWQRVDMP